MGQRNNIRIMVLSRWVLCAIFVVSVDSCNEASCGSIVSKCLLTKSCNCDLTAQTCSRECFNCLGHLYTECCSCLDLCPKSDELLDLGKTSQIEDFRDPVPQLFHVLTDYPDQLGRFIAKKIPMTIDLAVKVTEDNPNKPKVLTVNCTVVYWSRCMTWKKCKNSCLSMGSSSYRWFHDGCCECVGENCFNYGLAESKCKDCPEKDSNKEEDVDYLDYGENDGMMEYEE